MIISSKTPTFTNNFELILELKEVFTEFYESLKISNKAGISKGVIYTIIRQINYYINTLKIDMPPLDDMSNSVGSNPSQSYTFKCSKVPAVSAAGGSRRIRKTKKSKKSKKATRRRR